MIRRTRWPQGGNYNLSDDVKTSVRHNHAKQLQQQVFLLMPWQRWTLLPLHFSHRCVIFFFLRFSLGPVLWTIRDLTDRMYVHTLCTAYPLFDLSPSKKENEDVMQRLVVDHARACPCETRLLIRYFVSFRFVFPLVLFFFSSLFFSCRQCCLLDCLLDCLACLPALPVCPSVRLPACPPARPACRFSSSLLSRLLPACRCQSRSCDAYCAPTRKNSISLSHSLVMGIYVFSTLNQLEILKSRATLPPPPKPSLMEFPLGGQTTRESEKERTTPQKNN